MEAESAWDESPALTLPPGEVERVPVRSISVPFPPGEPRVSFPNSVLPPMVWCCELSLTLVYVFFCSDDSNPGLTCVCYCT